VASTFYYYGALAMGILLAWRFHTSRALFSLFTLLLAVRALDFFVGAHLPRLGPGRIAFEVVSFLLPINIAYLACVSEQGLAPAAVGRQLSFFFSQSVFVAYLCRPEAITSPYLYHHAWIDPSLTRWAVLPQACLLAFLVAGIIVLARFVGDAKPLTAGMFWSLATSFCALRSIGLSNSAQGYFGTAALSIVVSLVEASYVMAYHDELTGLPGRRAFSEALRALDGHFAIAAVDIDHFKSVNDTFGHDVGDQVLRLVASKLGQAGGGGKAFRCGGEEFAILFNGKSSSEVMADIERLRATIESSEFRPRGQDRRAQPRPDGDRRRTVVPRKPISRIVTPADRNTLRVTVSIGLAEPSLRTREVEQVIHEADEALYRAKRSGRNRIETAATKNDPTSRKTKARASGR
jgi:GGDEF domain-containing protein